MLQFHRITVEVFPLMSFCVQGVVWEWSNFLLHCCAKLLGVFLPFTLWNKAFFMVSSFQFNVEFLSGIYGVAHFLKLWLFVQWFFSICVSGYLMFLIFFPSSLTFFPRFLKKKACITKMLVRDISFGHDVLLEFWIWEKHNCEIQLHGCWNVPACEHSRIEVAKLGLLDNKCS